MTAAAADGPCPSVCDAWWDTERIHLECEREVGHPGPHSADEGEWLWADEQAARPPTS